MSTENAKRDENSVTTIQAVSLGSPHVPTNVYVDETTHRLLVNALIIGNYSEDAAHTSGDSGIFALGVRNDTLASLSDADLDYTPFAVERSGRQIYGLAPTAAMVRGTASVTDTTSTSLIAASGSASLKTYVVAVQVSNSGSTFADISFQDGNNGTTLGYGVAPATGGSIIPFPVPLVTTANTALYFKASASSTTIKVSAQGYLAP